MFITLQFNGFALFLCDLICVINYFGAGCRFVFKASFIFKIQIKEHKKKSSQINCLSLFYLRVISMLLGNLKLKKENPFINFRRFPSNRNKYPYSKLLHDSQKYVNFFHTFWISWSADLLSVLRLADLLELTWHVWRQKKTDIDLQNVLLSHPQDRTSMHIS